jgi:TonB family C-terminal domain
VDATISDAAIVRSNDRHRPWRRIAACVSVFLHAGVLAAALSGLTGESSQTEPDALTVALVAESASGGAAGNGGSGTGDAAASSGGPMRAAGDAGQAAESVAKEVRAGVSSPSPSIVQPAASRPAPRRPPRKAVSQHAPVQPPPQQPQAASEPPQPSPDPVPPSPAEAPVPGVTAEPLPSVANAAQSTATGADDSAVASRGDVEATGGSAAATGGGRGRGDRTRSGFGSGGGGETRGPGFALGSAGNPMPPYPSSARRRGIEGTVVVRVKVSAEGRALSVEIARSSGSDALDEAARDTIARWRFRPAKRGGEAIAATTSVPVQFSLVEP